MTRNIVIIGSGVAGLASAIFLRRLGHSITLYERQAKLSELGAGIVCWPNACFVLEQLGLLSVIKKSGGALRAMSRFNLQGQSLGSIDVELINRAMSGYPSYSILRKDLMRILEAEAIRVGATIRYGCKVQTITDVDTERATVLVNGEMISADLIIGADGRMNSIARQYVLGNNQPVFQQVVNWIGIANFADAHFTELSVFDFWGVGQRFGVVPVSATTAYWAAAEYLVADEEEVSQAVPTDKFADWPELVQQVLTHAESSSVRRIAIYDHNPADIWQKKNVLMLGDAAHAALPTSGQGACQALEDSWHLFEIMKQDPSMDDVGKRLLNVRKAKTDNILYAGRQLSDSLFKADQAQSILRNQRSIETDYEQVAQGMAAFWRQGLPMD